MEISGEMKGEKMKKEVYAKIIGNQVGKVFALYGETLRLFSKHIHLLKNKAIGELRGGDYKKTDFPILLVIPKSIVEIESQMAKIIYSSGNYAPTGFGKVSLYPPGACGFIITPPVNERIENISKPFHLPYFLVGVRRTECKNNEIGSGGRRFLNAEEVIALLTHFQEEIDSENLILIFGSKFFGKPLEFSLCEKYHRGFLGDYNSYDPTIHGEYQPGKSSHFEKLITYTFRKRIL